MLSRTLLAYATNWVVKELNLSSPPHLFCDNRFTGGREDHNPRSGNDQFPSSNVQNIDPSQCMGFGHSLDIGIWNLGFPIGGCWNRTNFFGSSDRRDDHIRKPSGVNDQVPSSNVQRQPMPRSRALGFGHWTFLWTLGFGSWTFLTTTSWGI